MQEDRQDDPYLNFVADLWLDTRQLKLSACIKMASAGGGARMAGMGRGRGEAVHRGDPATVVILRREGKEAFQNKSSHTSSARMRRWRAMKFGCRIIIGSMSLCGRDAR